MRIKRLIAVLVCMAMVFAILPVMTITAATWNDINAGEVFLKQEGSTTCTLCAATMLLRRSAILLGRSDWRSITESSVKSTAWINGSGLRWNFTYSGIEIGHGTLPTGSSNTEVLINLLNNHPEGIVIYRSGANQHAVLLTDYTNGTFYCADPYGGKPTGRIPISSALYVTISNVSAYWYVVNPAIPQPGSGVSPDPGPTPEQTSTIVCLDSPRGGSSYDGSDHIEISGWMASNTAPTFIMAEIDGGYGQINLNLEDSPSEAVQFPNHKYFKRFRGVIDKAKLTPNSTYQFKIFSNISDGTYNTTFYTGNFSNVPGPGPTNCIVHLDYPSGTYNEYNHIEISGWIASHTSPGYIMAEIDGGYGQINLGYADSPLEAPQFPDYESFKRFRGVIDVNKLTSYTTYTIKIFSDVQDAIYTNTFSTGNVEAPKYSLSFNANGGTGAPSGIVIKKGESATVPETVPVKPGYRFLGWSTSETSSEASYDAGSSITITSNTTLYAVWKYDIVSVTNVELSTSHVTLYEGESVTLTATVAPSNATNKSVTWKSSNTAVATVENGVVKAVKAGSATITVTTADGGKTASCAVTVEEKQAQYSADIAVGNVSGRAGDTVTVPVVISNNPGIAAFKLKVTYDKERLVPVSITKGSILTGSITSNIQQGGDMTRFDYVTAYWDNPSDFTADGELFNVTFKINDSAEEGNIPVGISYVKGEVANQKYEDVDLNVTEGNVSVRNVMMGDTFEDGEVNSKDGLKLRQYLAEWAVNLSEREKAAADVFKDGEINSKDGLKLRQYLAEWDVSLETVSLMDVGSISFEAGSVSAASGEYVDIPINITENSGVAVFNLRVEFDKEKLIPVSITKGDALEGVITSNIQQGGDMERFDYVTAYWDNPSNVTGTGTAFTVRFKVKDGAEGEAPIRLTSKAGDICDQSFNDLEVKFTDGAVTIGGGEISLPYTVNSFETETPSNGRVYARISVTKNEERAGADALVIAVYNKNGELIDTSAMQGVFEKGQTMTFRSRVFYEDGCTMKAFVWESIEDMVPISNVIAK